MLQSHLTRCQVFAVFLLFILLPAAAFGGNSTFRVDRFQRWTSSRIHGSPCDIREEAIPNAFDIKFAFNKWTLGEAFCTDTLGIAAELLDNYTFNLLGHLGFDDAQIEAANIHVCGAMTLESAVLI